MSFKILQTMQNDNPFRKQTLGKILDHETAWSVVVFKNIFRLLYSVIRK